MQPRAKWPLIGWFGPWQLQSRGLPEAGAILPYIVSGVTDLYVNICQSSIWTNKYSVFYGQN